jgi:DNA-binding response OmpR family regulator
MIQKQVPRILMFEDDDEIMQSLQHYLQQEKGWNVDLSADAGLLERLSRERYDLLLVDIMVHREKEVNGVLVLNVQFPGVHWRKTGLEFLKQLRRGEYSSQIGTPPNVPVIILSAVVDSSIETELGREINVQGIFEKPFILAKLASRMCELLGERCDADTP